MCAKNYENIVRFDKVIAKITRVQFFASQCVMCCNLFGGIATAPLLLADYVTTGKG